MGSRWHISVHQEDLKTYCEEMISSAEKTLVSLSLPPKIWLKAIITVDSLNGPPDVELPIEICRKFKLDIKDDYRSGKINKKRQQRFEAAISSVGLAAMASKALKTKDPNVSFLLGLSIRFQDIVPKTDELIERHIRSRQTVRGLHHQKSEETISIEKAVAELKKSKNTFNWKDVLKLLESSSFIKSLIDKKVISHVSKVNLHSQSGQTFIEFYSHENKSKPFKTITQKTFQTKISVAKKS